MSKPAGYSGTPLAKKLGLRAGDALLLVAGPPGWSVPDPPVEVSVTAEPHGSEAEQRADVILAFHTELSTLRESIPMLAPRIFPDGAIWASWPRRAAGHESDIREQDIRDIALPLGLVDVKIAAIDEDWSGLRLVWRRENR